jgi:hypothetical protein
LPATTLDTLYLEMKLERKHLHKQVNVFSRRELSIAAH